MYRCGSCEAACPPAASAIRYIYNAKELKTILPACVEAGAESIELHAEYLIIKQQ